MAHRGARAASVQLIRSLFTGVSEQTEFGSPEYVCSFAFMPRERKFYLIQIGTSQPRNVSNAQWSDFLSRRLIRQVGKHLAVLCEGVKAFTSSDGTFDLEFVASPYIRNSWRQWEIAWLFAAQSSVPASYLTLGYFARQEHAMRERQNALDEDAVLWEWKRRGRNVDVK